MRYIADENGYLLDVSFGADISCNDKECTEYTGDVPEGYDNLVDWFAQECDKLHRWHIVEGQLTFDESAVDPPSAEMPDFMTLVWENDAPDTAITTKTLTVNLRGYDLVAIEYKFKTSTEQRKIAFGKVGTSVALDVISQSFYLGSRICELYNDRVEILAADYSAGGSADPKNYMIPTRIYGIKGKTTVTVVNTDGKLPFGGSSAWLDDNGDVSQLYQIDGYVWGYVEGTGWTKSGTRFRVVSSEGAMTNTDGLPYLLREGDAGTVYAFQEASGDANTPVYDGLPETANEGDIVAVGGKKYKASVTTGEVLNCTNLAKNFETGRISSSGGIDATSTAATTVADYFLLAVGDVFRIKGFGALDDYNTAFYSDNTGSVVSASKPSTWPGTGYGSYTYDAASETAIITILTVSNNKYMRVSGKLTGTTSDVVITKNEEITTRTETIVKWTEVGTYQPPVAAGWKPTGETRDVIDSITTAGSNGQEAVYSSDGYVYTYIAGATWMALSKYEESGGPVDKEFSYTSTNAVQNKVITAKFEELEIEAKSNSAEIAELNVKVAGLVTGGQTTEVPAVWKNAVAACIAKIKALQVGRNCITFPFFSDNHQRNGYAGLLIAHIMKECSIPYCFFGGDSISSGTIADEAEMIAQDRAFDSIMAYVPNGRFCRAVGNHDGYWTDGTNKFYYDRDGIYDLFLREEAIAQNKHFGDDGTYYYVDDIASKVRFVVLNTNGIQGESKTFDSTQLAWLQNTALQFSESNWAAVFISHQPITNNYHSLISNAGEVQEIIEQFIADGGNVVGWFAGHIHRDRIFEGGYGTVTYKGKSYTSFDENQNSRVNASTGKTETYSLSTDTLKAPHYPLPFKTITITSDATSIAYDEDMKHAIASDDQSHAIDFVTINKATRKVNITRLGIGSDRSYTY